MQLSDHAGEEDIFYGPLHAEFVRNTDHNSDPEITWKLSTLSLIRNLIRKGGFAKYPSFDAWLLPTSIVRV